MYQRHLTTWPLEWYHPSPGVAASIAPRVATASNGVVHGAVAMWVRAGWRRRIRAVVGLALLAGLAGAVVLTAVAGARRTSTSFQRFARESSSADVVIDVGAVDPEIVDQIAQLAMVDGSGAVTVVFALVEGVETDLAIWAPRDGRIGVEIERDRVLRGRLPDPASVTEVAVSESAAEIVGADVGDDIEIGTMTPEQVMNEEYFPALGPRLHMQVVGVVRTSDDLVSSGDGGFHVSQAFLDTVHGQVDEWTTYLLVDLADGATAADFQAAVGELVPSGQEYAITSSEVRSKPARGTISAIASGLAVFAAVAALAAMVAVGQAVGRHVINAQHDEETLGMLGVTPAGRRAALVALTLPIAVGGAVLAATGAWLASPLMPVGLARKAEPHPGLDADWAVLGVGGISVALVVFVSAMVTAAWITRARRVAAFATRALGRCRRDLPSRRRSSRRQRGTSGARPPSTGAAGAIGDSRGRRGDPRNRRRADVLGKPRPPDHHTSPMGVWMGSAAQLQLQQRRRRGRTDRHR